MKISIVTPMYNSSAYIGRMIEALKNLDFPQDQIEFIFIDNGSTDNTVDLVKQQGIEVIAMPGASISAMRNHGAFLAKGEYLGFIDSDCLVQPSWANNAIEGIENDAQTGILGGYYGLGDDPNWVEKTWHELKQDVVGEVSFVSAGNMVMKKDLFVSIDGFDENVETGEDWDICQRTIDKGYKVVNVNNLKVKHLGNVKTLLNIIRKERWYGRGMFSVLKGRIATKPLLAALAFLVAVVLLTLSILTGNHSWSGLLLAFILALVGIVSIYLTRNVKRSRVHTMLRMLPISFCYLVGRSLSVVDIVVNKLTSGSRA